MSMANTVDTEFRGVTGTLVANSTFDSEAAEKAHVEKFEQQELTALKKARDGVTILIPQPSNDPNDPLNWSRRKKWSIMAIVAYCAAMPDMQAGFGIPLVVPQAIYWDISITDSGRSMSGNVFMIGIGSLIAVPVVQRYGRLPTLFWSMFLSFWMTLGATLVNNHIGFIALRCLQTTFSAAPQVIGLSFVHDMFFFHEHGRAIGIWACAFVLSPFVGPFLSGIIANFKPWRASLGLSTAMTGLATILVVFFVPETLYNRHAASVGLQKPKSSIGLRTKELVGIQGSKVKGRPSLTESSIRLLTIAIKPYFLLVLVFYAATFMWSVGCNTSLILFLFAPVEAGGYGFSQLTVALLYLAPITATGLGEVFGHFFNDWLAISYIRRHKGIYEPEVRLWAVAVATPFMVGGLVFLGFTFRDHLPWVAIAFAWGIYVYGTLVATVGITAYALDIFQEEAAEASALINFSRTISGFIVNYFQVAWADSVGVAASFGTQAAICFAAWLLIVVVQWKGKDWRERFPARATKSVVSEE